MNKAGLGKMSRPELLELQDDIKTELKNRRPYRIKERVTRCGKEGCWCAEGQNGHGPYLYVTYREHGKTQAVGLGPKLEEWEMLEAYLDLPDVGLYLTTPDYKYVLMTHDETEDWFYYTMTPRQFKERYGVSKAEDKFGRPDKFWGSNDAHIRYESDHAIAIEERNIPHNEWSCYGVSTLRGIAVLKELEKRGYYLKGAE